jgi:hypothetical protein
LNLIVAASAADLSDRARPGRHREFLTAFVAKSEPIAKLTAEEQAALETLVTVLNSRQ